MSWKNSLLKWMVWSITNGGDILKWFGTRNVSNGSSHEATILT